MSNYQNLALILVLHKINKTQKELIKRILISDDSQGYIRSDKELFEANSLVDDFPHLFKIVTYSLRDIKFLLLNNQEKKV